MSVLLVQLYASPPLNCGGDKKSWANLWPFNSVRRLPFFGSHRMILLSPPPIARTLLSKRHATVLTQALPLVEIQM